MKIIKAMTKVFRKEKKEDVQYYDHYMMLGAVLGSYCGMLRFGRNAAKRSAG